MLPSPQARVPMGWGDLIFRIAIVFALAWFLVNGLWAINQTAGNPKEFDAADRALKANDVNAARAQLDQYLKVSANSLNAYKMVIVYCGMKKRSDLVDRYFEMAQSNIKGAPQEDLADLYRTTAGAYLDCGSQYADKALANANQAMTLDPKGIDSMNSLAYTLACTSTDPAQLDRAKQLILTAMNKLNDQAGLPDRQLHLFLYGDTYGWVLYKEGLYGPKADASKNFTQAADVLIEVTDAVPEGLAGSVLTDIYYHLGAAFSRAGRPEDARNALSVALQYDPANADAKQELQSLPPPVLQTAERSGSEPDSVSPAGNTPASVPTAVATPTPGAFTPLPPLHATGRR